jgi:hypothetical protein
MIGLVGAVLARAIQDFLKIRCAPRLPDQLVGRRAHGVTLSTTPEHVIVTPNTL